MSTGLNTSWFVDAGAVGASDNNAGGFRSSNANATKSLTDNYCYGASFTTITVTDLASSNGTNATPAVSSVTRPFVAGDAGHILRITAGTNWTPGLYEISSVAAGVATLAGACGTAASLSSGSATMGGALASPGQAGAHHNGGDTIYGTSHGLTNLYVLDCSGDNVSGKALLLKAGNTSGTQWFGRLVGYDSTLDDGGRAYFQMSGTATKPGVRTADGGDIRNISLDCNNLANNGFQGGNVGYSICFNCEVFNIGANKTGFAIISTRKCIARTSNATGIQGFGPDAQDCWAYDILGSNARGFSNLTGDYFRCVALRCQTGFSVRRASHCVARACGTGFSCGIYGAYGPAFLDNCIATECTGYGYVNSATSTQPAYHYHNAAWSNSSGNWSSELTPYKVGCIDLTGDPFVDAANGDYSLNDIAGAGDACRSAGYFAVAGLPLTVGAPDIGVCPMGVTTADKAAIAALILATPAQKLVTDASGQVAVGTIANDAITAASLKADAVTEIQTGLATPTNITAASGVALTADYDDAKTAAQAGDAMTLTAAYDAAKTAAQAGTALDNTVWTNTKAGYLTGDAFARLGAPAGASVSADIADLHTHLTTLVALGVVTITQPVTTQGTVSILYGYDYAGSLAPTFALPVATCPDLTGATLVQVVHTGDRATAMPGTFTVTDPGTANQAVVWTIADTEYTTTTRENVILEATLASGLQVALWNGTLVAA